MCLYPKLITNPKYKSTKKNGGEIPAVKDDRVKYVPIGCGNCMECRRKKAREWQVRLLEDIKTNKHGKFITLTFSDKSIAELDKEINKGAGAILEGYQRDNAIATIAVRRFMERHRKRFGISLRHWLVTELGHNGTENIHLHGIIWTDRNLNTIEKLWSYGWMWKGKKVNDTIVNYVNEATVNYMTKYINKKDEVHTEYKSIVLTSAGIGGNYTQTRDAKKNEFNGKETREVYRTRTGHKITLPIYWRNKIYTEDERETLWLQKLDKQIRYVGGEKIDVSKGEDNYWATLKWYQQLNKELGYGDDTKDWSKQQYEQEKRTLMIKTRIANAEKKTS